MTALTAADFERTITIPWYLARDVPVIGFDPSISHSAAHWAANHWATPGVRDLGGFGPLKSFAIKSDPKHYPHRLARVNHIRSQLLERVHAISHEYGKGLFVVEGYAIGSRTSQQHTLAEWGGQLRLTMFDLGWEVLEVPPATLKKYASGKGNTEKDGMRMEVLKRWGYESTDNNDCDAFALMRFGFDWLAWKSGKSAAQALVASLSKAEHLSASAKYEPPPEKSKKRKSKAQQQEVAS